MPFQNMSFSLKLQSIYTKYILRNLITSILLTDPSKRPSLDEI